jgi:hypothetical protein
LLSETIAAMSQYRLEVDPNKVIAPVTRQFASYNLVPLANAIYYGSAAYSIVGLGGMLGVEAFTAIPELLPAPTTPLSPAEMAALQDAFSNPGTLPSSAQVQNILADALWRRGYTAAEIVKLLNGGL